MEQIIIGTLMIAVTVAIHAFASARWLGVVGRWHATRESSNHMEHLLWSMLSTGMVLIVLHIVEANLWALLYWKLPSHAGLESLPQALYFSMVTFTTLGYGDITLSTKWQILGPMEAMAGITVIGLTTAILFAVIQRSWKISHAAKT